MNITFTFVALKQSSFILHLRKVFMRPDGIAGTEKENSETSKSLILLYKID